MTVKDVCKVHYLSCVEAYFGAWIRNRVELPALYCESFITWSEIAGLFAEGNAEYASFSAIKRLQDLAEEVGLTRHERKKGMIRLDECHDGELTLLSVNESFIKGRKPWRNDHYIAVEKLTDKTLRYINEYPLETGEVFLAEFKDEFGGTCLIYSTTEAFERHELIKRSELQVKRLCKSENKREVAYIDSEKRLRDAIGILRVSRKRTLEWLIWYARNSYVEKAEEIQRKLTKQIAYADNCFFRLQSMIIRDQTNGAVLREITERLFETEPIGFTE